VPPSPEELPADEPRADLLRRLQSAWNRGDLDTMMATHHADAVWVVIGGLEQLVGREFQASFGQVHIEVEEAIPAGDRLLLILDQRNRGEAGGVETSNRWAQLLSFREGLVVRAENYYDVDEALAAIQAS
jgi:ketosteroid isomerase-like protein